MIVDTLWFMIIIILIFVSVVVVVVVVVVVFLRREGSLQYCKPVIGFCKFDAGFRLVEVLINISNTVF